MAKGTERSIRELVETFRADPSSLKPSELAALRKLAIQQRLQKRVEAPPDYEAVRADAAARSRARSLAGREIGPIPKVKNRKRRRAAEQSFRVFCERYFKGTFYLAWGQDHLKAIAKIERAVLHGGLMAFAMRRGAGKTSLCECAALWAMLCGHRHFVALIGSESGAATEMLESIKFELETNEALSADFPEVVYPISKLEGIAQRANGQLQDGHRTHMKWEESMIILPTVKRSRASGAIVKVAGITGRVRGMKHKRKGGITDRPDLVIVDDPQTRESAKSRQQVRERLMIIKNDVLGLAGPGKKIAGFCPCTVVVPDDLADQILNREVYPEWQGERFKMLNSFPSDAALWSEYEKLLIEDTKAERGPARATAFYRKNRAAMDADAVASWPASFEPGEVSAIQSAMNLKILRPTAFWAEYQNQPLPEERQEQKLAVAQIAGKLNGVARGQVPVECTHLVAFIDVGEMVLSYAVAGWSDDFAGAVVDYGVFPDQCRPYFTLRDAQYTLAGEFPRAGLEGRIYAGLGRLADQLLGHPWKRADGAELRIELCLIDANWGDSTDVVYQFCRQSAHGAVLLPSHGRYVGAASLPFSLYKKQPGERVGHNWRVPSIRKTRAIRHVIFDTNYWKSFVYARLATATGDPGALNLFGQKPDAHRLFAEHLTAEYSVRTTGRGREVDEWKQKPNAPDNHWFDCLVGCAVAGSMRGATLDSVRPVKAVRISGASTHPAARRSFSDRQRVKQLQRNG